MKIRHQRCMLASLVSLCPLDYEKGRFIFNDVNENNVQTCLCSDELTRDHAGMPVRLLSVRTQ